MTLSLKSCVPLFVVGLVVLISAAYTHFFFLEDDLKCKATFLRPAFVPVPHIGPPGPFSTKYALYLDKDTIFTNKLELEGAPVLFVHGHAGSYRSAGCFGSELAHLYYLYQHGHYKVGQPLQPFDLFTVDFNEEFTAFDGLSILHLSYHLNEVIRDVLGWYTVNSTAGSYKSHSGLPLPKSVTLVCHSMGGIVARTAMMLPNYVPGSVESLITLASPHTAPPAEHERLAHDIYDSVNNYWRKNSESALKNVTLVSIAGGRPDLMVHSHLSDTSNLMPSSKQLSVYTTAIPTVWTANNHNSLLWCNQLIRTLALALYETANFSLSTKLVAPEERLATLKRIFSPYDPTPSSGQRSLVAPKPATGSLWSSTQREDWMLSAVTPSRRLFKLEDWRFDSNATETSRALNIWTNVQLSQLVLCSADRCSDIRPLLIKVPAFDASRDYFRPLENASWALSVANLSSLLPVNGRVSLFARPQIPQSFLLQEDDSYKRNLPKQVANPFFWYVAPKQPFLHVRFVERSVTEKTCPLFGGCGTAVNSRGGPVQLVRFKALRYRYYPYRVKLFLGDSVKKAYPGYSLLFQDLGQANDAKWYPFNHTSEQLNFPLTVYASQGADPKLAEREGDVYYWLFMDPSIDSEISLNVYVDRWATFGYLFRNSRTLLIAGVAAWLFAFSVPLYFRTRSVLAARIAARGTYMNTWAVVSVAVLALVLLQMHTALSAELVFWPLIAACSLATVILVYAVLVYVIMPLIGSALSPISSELFLHYWRAMGVPVFAVLVLSIFSTSLNVPNHVLTPYAFVWSCVESAVVHHSHPAKSAASQALSYKLMLLCFASVFDIPGLIVWIQNFKHDWDVLAAKELTYGPHFSFARRDDQLTWLQLGPLLLAIGTPLVSSVQSVKRFRVAVRRVISLALSPLLSVSTRLKPYTFLKPLSAYDNASLAPSATAARPTALASRNVLDDIMVFLSLTFAFGSLLYYATVENVHLYLVHEYVQLWSYWIFVVSVVYLNKV